MPNITTNIDRLWKSLEDMARVGATKAGGSCRVALTDEDKAGRDLFASWVREAGCEMVVDEVGNMFARRAGQDTNAAPVMMGSHLDTQPTGGRFGGVFGVLAGLEVFRTLNDQQIQTRRPLELAVWSNEEGARFQPAMMGSGVFCGMLSRAIVDATTDEAGLSFGDELERIGYRGHVSAMPRSLHAYIEAHIEQGPILEVEGKTIGVVTGIQGIKWFKARILGTNAHAGTTPMEVRRDPLITASRLVDGITRLTRAERPDAVATVGMFTVLPGSINVINQEVRFSLDLRCPDEMALEELSTKIRQLCDETAQEAGVGLDLEEIWHAAPTVFAESVVTAVDSAAAMLGHSRRPIVSGAGHDAKHLAGICPTGMIFIPCRDGISHNEAEAIEQADAGAGADVLLHAILELAG